MQVRTIWNGEFRVLAIVQWTRSFSSSDEMEINFGDRVTFKILQRPRSEDLNIFSSWQIVNFEKNVTKFIIEMIVFFF